MLQITSAIVLWGIWGLLEKLALRNGSPYETIFVFYAWTAVLFFPLGTLMLKRYGSFQIDRRVWFWIFVAVMTDLVAMLGLRFAMLDNLIGPVLAATAAYPIVTTILSKKFLHEEITKTQFVGIGLACVGVFLLGI